MTKSNFIPADYTPPSASNNYMKFAAGDNKFRALSSPIMGWLEWQDKKPIRTEEKPTEFFDAENPPKHFWALKVFDYADDSVKILEITQASVIKAIVALNSDKDWGAPTDYDIKVVKTGTSLKTKYAVTPLPKKPIAKHILAASNERECDLELMFQGKDPFVSEQEAAPEPKKKGKRVPF